LFNDKNILITGGTGSFGNAFTAHLLENYNPRKVIIYSRDEEKQRKMAAKFPQDCMRWFIGDVRDLSRLCTAFGDVDIVIHAAAMKQIPAVEYNPREAVKTNIYGTENVIAACMTCGVERAVFLSSDKSVSPLNLYGMTKGCAEKLWVQANVYGKTRFSCTRYGNVVGSRGSVVPIFLEQYKEGVFTITDERMTRFWMTLGQAVELVVDCVRYMRGCEIFIPDLPSMRVTDLAFAISPKATLDFIGIRPGEKLHEELISQNEARSAYSAFIDGNKRYVILPETDWGRVLELKEVLLPLGADFCYSSDTARKLTEAELRKMIAALDLPGVEEWAKELSV
jgi:UDP-N-acetylglucosamine 4,6-dehydratase